MSGASVGIDPLSVVPLHLECFRRGGTVKATGTGFLTVGSDRRTHLVTNGHVFTGRHPDTGQPVDPSGFADPDFVRVWYHSANGLGAWNAKEHELRDPRGGASTWLQHPSGLSVDVVALPVALDADVKPYPLHVVELANSDVMVIPSEQVSIVGFPFGLSVGKLPIWKTGHVASDIDVNYEGMPRFLIDATTNPGMSGSPVIARRIGFYRSRAGNNVLGGEANRFLGVYSGRIRPDADIGIVWKPEALTAIIGEGSP